MQTWTQSAKRAAITGKVIDAATLRAVRGVSATLTAMPAAFQQQLARKALACGDAWSALTERPDRTSTAADGGFRFVDLPDGAYTVAFSVSHARRLYGATQASFTVARDASGAIPLNVQIVRMPPTAVQGKLKGGATPALAVPLPMARVKVRGSGAVAFGDVNGHFYVTGADPGPRTLDITASGYQPISKTATIVEGQIRDLGLILLGP